MPRRFGGALGFWGGIVATALLVGAIGALIEVVLLRRIYRAPELFQLLATFALVLVINDATLWLWGPEDLLGPRAPGLRGAVEVLGRRLPSYDLFLIVVGAAGAAGCCISRWRETRFGRLVRAATQDREMVGALGVNQAMLFTAVFALGSLLAGLGGALQVAREPANLATDLIVISDAFVVVVVGGMGSITGAYLAAVIIAEVKALCIGIGVVDFAGISVNFSKFTLVAEFLVMAVVLIARPYGLLGRPQGAVRSVAEPEEPIRPATPALKIARRSSCWWCCCACRCWRSRSPYTLVLGIDVLIAVLFATSLHFIMGPGGMHSFGHAAYFGLGAYGAALLVKWLAAPMGVALAAAPVAGAARRAAVRLVRGAAVRRLSRHADARLRADRLGDGVPVGGVHRRLQRRDRRLADRAVRHALGAYYLLTLALAVVGVLLLRRILFAPFGYAMRAGRDSPLRAEAIGIDVKRVHWLAFAIAGAVCGVAGGLFAFAKGSISPETIGVGRSIDGLVMVLLGGIQTLTGPIVGASVFAVLQDTVMRADRILARAARRHHPGAGAGVPERHRRRASRS